MKFILTFLFFYTYVVFAQKNTCSDDFKIKYTNKEYYEALKIVETCSEIAKDTSLYNLQARSYMYTANYHKASEVYRQLVKVAPTNYLYAIGAGSAFLEMEQYDSALHYYYKSLAAKPINSYSRLNLGIVYYEIDAYEKAMEHLEIHISEFPEDTRARRLIGDVCSIMEADERALPILNKAIEIAPNDPLNYGARGECYLGLEKYDLALIDVNKGIELDSKNAKLFQLKGDIFYLPEEADFEEAIKWYKRAIKIEKKGSLYYFVGLCLQYLDKYNESITYLKQACEISPSDNDYLSEYAYSLYKTDQLSLALDKINQAIKLNSNNPEHYYYRAIIYDDLEKYDEAITDINKALTFKENVRYYNERASCNHSLKNKEAAILDYQKSIALDNTAAYAYYNRALLYMHYDEYEAAILDFTQAIKLDSLDKHAYYNRAICFFNLKKLEDYCKDIRKAAELGDPEAKQYLKDDCQ